MRRRACGLLIPDAKRSDLFRHEASAGLCLEAAAATDMVLPGSIQAIEETPIYARANGYLRRRLVDIGDRVHAGQLLAEIETPELDQQFMQARASLPQARANLAQSRATMELARITAGRWDEFERRDLVARQEVDQQRAAFAVSQATFNAARANVEAQEANVRQLEALQSFRRVTAPAEALISTVTDNIADLYKRSSNMRFKTR